MRYLILILLLCLCACDKYRQETFLVNEVCVKKAIEVITYTEPVEDMEWGMYYDWARGEYVTGYHPSVDYETKEREAAFVYTDKGNKFEVRFSTYELIQLDHSIVSVEYIRKFRNDVWYETEIGPMKSIQIE